MAVQAYLHVCATVTRDTVSTEAPGAGKAATAIVGGSVEVSLDQNAYSSNNALLFMAADLSAAPSNLKWTHTPLSDKPRYKLKNEEKMTWRGGRVRKCTLRSELIKGFERDDISTCGHVFCWICTSDWERGRYKVSALQAETSCAACASFDSSGRVKVAWVKKIPVHTEIIVH